jgi:hypothetical protein
VAVERKKDPIMAVTDTNKILNQEPCMKREVSKTKKYGKIKAERVSLIELIPVFQKSPPEIPTAVLTAKATGGVTMESIPK